MCCVVVCPPTIIVYYTWVKDTIGERDEQQWDSKGWDFKNFVYLWQNIIDKL